MSESQSQSQDQVTVNVKGPSEIKLTVTIELSATVRELKEAITKQKQDVPPESQRLIYAGKVLKDEQPLSEYKLQNNHTIHLVKSASVPSTSGSASNPSSATPSSSSAAAGGGTSSNPSATSAASPSNNSTSAQHGVPANFGAGQQFTNNPLAALNRADLAGPHMASIGRQMFQGTGMNPADPNMMMNALDSEEFQQHLRSMLRRPEVIDQMIAMNPQMAGMAPQMREMMQSEEFINMMTNPETMRRAMRMQEAMGGGGRGGPGLGGGMGSLFGGGGQQQQQQQWPPPGAFGTPGGPSGDSDANRQQQQGQGAAGSDDPFAALAGLAGRGAGGGLGGMGGGFDPALLQQILGGGAGGESGQGQGGLGSNPFASFLGGAGGGAGSGAGAGGDSRPPEERYASQLQQLRDMGFVDGQANLRALLISGGSVEGAISILLG
ncbi:unnamed protein product [Sympodiomycopsis kandeliae]